jgi:HEPN domain-containing protein
MSASPDPAAPLAGPTTAAAWAQKAEHDILDADNNIAAEQTPWDMVCFHAQQAAEKYLKALLVARGELPPRIHDLDALLERCLAHDPTLSDLRADCTDLASYAVEVRYPDDLFEMTESDGRRAIAAARRVQAKIRPLLQPKVPLGGE